MTSRTGIARAATLATLAALVSVVACKKENAPRQADAAPPTVTVADAGPRACASDAECPSGERCWYENAGCAEHGVCGPPKPGHECYVAIPMCSCARKVTFWGGGGCAGQGVTEPWELYGCPCTTDADCRGGQVCGRASYAGQGAPAKVCEDKKKR